RSVCSLCLQHAHRAIQARPSVPTRRSSDLLPKCTGVGGTRRADAASVVSPWPSSTIATFISPVGAMKSVAFQMLPDNCRTPQSRDRKSTRLNSSHVKTSYAVFCLKKRNKQRFIDWVDMVYTSQLSYVVFGM